MIELGQHWEFIFWGYAGVAAVVAGLIGWTMIGARRQKARLEQLEAQGLTRRRTR